MAQEENPRQDQGTVCCSYNSVDHLKRFTLANTVIVSQSIHVCVFFGQNVTANHRVNDAVFTEGGLQIVTGRFMYGPLDMVTLTGEKVGSLSQQSV